MAVIKSKGTALQQYISNTYVAVAQMIDIDGPDMASEEFEADTLDNASSGITYAPTGRTEFGNVSGNLFFDPALAGHQAILALLTTPALQNWKLSFPTTPTATLWSFSGSSVKLKPTASLKEGLKASIGIKVNGNVNFAAS